MTWTEQSDSRNAGQQITWRWSQQMATHETRWPSLLVRFRGGGGCALRGDSSTYQGGANEKLIPDIPGNSTLCSNTCARFSQDLCILYANSVTHTVQFRIFNNQLINVINIIQGNTNHKTQFMKSTDAYAFRHRTAIFKEWIEMKRWTCESWRRLSGDKTRKEFVVLIMSCVSWFILYSNLLSVFVG
jgi:hypothetical protein